MWVASAISVTVLIVYSSHMYVFVPLVLWILLQFEQYNNINGHTSPLVIKTFAVKSENVILSFHPPLLFPTFHKATDLSCLFFLLSFSWCFPDLSLSFFLKQCLVVMFFFCFCWVLWFLVSTLLYVLCTLDLLSCPTWLFLSLLVVCLLFCHFWLELGSVWYTNDERSRITISSYLLLVNPPPLPRPAGWLRPELRARFTCGEFKGQCRSGAAI